MFIDIGFDISQIFLVAMLAVKGRYLATFGTIHVKHQLFELEKQQKIIFTLVIFHVQSLKCHNLRAFEVKFLNFIKIAGVKDWTNIISGEGVSVTTLCKKCCYLGI